MATLGKGGMRRLAESNVARAHETRDRLLKEAKLVPTFEVPFFNEFVVNVKGLTQKLHRFDAKRIVPGIPLKPWFPELEESLLVCVTEMNGIEEIDQLVETFTKNR